MARDRLTTEEFVARAIRAHSDFYFYDKTKYHTSHHFVTITCPDHGDFKQKAYSHLQGTGCPVCGVTQRAKNQVDWLKEAKLVHDEKYDYSLVEYVANNKKVTIICPDHGEFGQEPQLHTRGHGCQKCANERRGSNGVYCSSYFSSHKEETGVLYVVEMKSTTERFVKIGISKNHMGRFSSFGTNYKVTPIQIEEMSLSNAYKKEQQIKSNNRDLAYVPQKKFYGYTECFTPLILGRLGD